MIDSFNLGMIDIITPLITGIGELICLVYLIIINTTASLVNVNESGSTTNIGYLDGVFNQIAGSNGLFKLDSKHYAPTFGGWAGGMCLVACALVIIFFVWQLFRSFFGKFTETEEPFKICARGTIYLAAVNCFFPVINWVYEAIFLPIYKILVDNGKEATTSAMGAGALDTVLKTAFNAINSSPAAFITAGSPNLQNAFFNIFPVSLIALILFIFFNSLLLKRFAVLVLEIFERYIVSFLLTLFGPICVAFGANKSTSAISQKWASAFGCSLVLMCFSILFCYTFLIGYMAFCTAFTVGPDAVTGEVTGGLIDATVKFILLYCWCRAGGQIDEYMQNLGFSLIRTGAAANDLLAAGSSGMARFTSGLNHAAGAAAGAMANTAALQGTGMGNALNAFRNAGGGLAGLGAAGVSAAGAAAVGGIQAAMNKAAAASGDTSGASKTMGEKLTQAANGTFRGNSATTQKEKNLIGQMINQKTGSNFVVNSSELTKDGCMTYSAKNGNEEIHGRIATDKTKLADRDGVVPNCSEFEMDGQNFYMVCDSKAGPEDSSGVRQDTIDCINGTNNSDENVKNTNGTEDLDVVPPQPVGNADSTGSTGDSTLMKLESSGETIAVENKDGKAVEYNENGDVQLGGGYYKNLNASDPNNALIAKSKFVKDENAEPKPPLMQNSSTGEIYEVKTNNAGKPVEYDKNGNEAINGGFYKNLNATNPSETLISKDNLKEIPQEAPAAVFDEPGSFVVGTIGDSKIQEFKLEKKNGIANTTVYSDQQCTKPIPASQVSSYKGAGYMRGEAGIIKLSMTGNGTPNALTFKKYKDLGATNTIAMADSKITSRTNVSKAFNGTSVEVNRQTGAVTKANASNITVSPKSYKKTTTIPSQTGGSGLTVKTAYAPKGSSNSSFGTAINANKNSQGVIQAYEMKDTKSNNVKIESSSVLGQQVQHLVASQDNGACTAAFSVATVEKGGWVQCPSGERMNVNSAEFKEKYGATSYYGATDSADNIEGKSFAVAFTGEDSGSHQCWTKVQTYDGQGSDKGVYAATETVERKDDLMFTSDASEITSGSSGITYTKKDDGFYSSDVKDDNAKYHYNEQTQNIEKVEQVATIDDNNNVVPVSEYADSLVVSTVYSDDSNGNQQVEHIVGFKGNADDYNVSYNATEGCDAYSESKISYEQINQYENGVSTVDSSVFISKEAADKVTNLDNHEGDLRKVDKYILREDIPTIPLKNGQLCYFNIGESGRAAQEAQSAQNVNRRSKNSSNNNSTQNMNQQDNDFDHVQREILGI